MAMSSSSRSSSGPAPLTSSSTAAKARRAGGGTLTGSTDSVHVPVEGGSSASQSQAETQTQTVAMLWAYRALWQVWWSPPLLLLVGPPLLNAMGWILDLVTGNQSLLFVILSFGIFVYGYACVRRLSGSGTAYTRNLSKSAFRIHVGSPLLSLAICQLHPFKPVATFLQWPFLPWCWNWAVTSAFLGLLLVVRHVGRFSIVRCSHCPLMIHPLLRQMRNLILITAPPVASATASPTAARYNYRRLASPKVVTQLVQFIAALLISMAVTYSMITLRVESEGESSSSEHAVTTFVSVGLVALVPVAFASLFFTATTGNTSIEAPYERDPVVAQTTTTRRFGRTRGLLSQLLPPKWLVFQTVCITAMCSLIRYRIYGIDIVIIDNNGYDGGVSGGPSYDSAFAASSSNYLAWFYFVSSTLWTTGILGLYLYLSEEMLWKLLLSRRLDWDDVITECHRKGSWESRNTVLRLITTSLLGGDSGVHLPGAQSSNNNNYDHRISYGTTMANLEVVEVRRQEQLAYQTMSQFTTNASSKMEASWEEDVFRMAVLRHLGDDSLEAQSNLKEWLRLPQQNYRDTVRSSATARAGTVISPLPVILVRGLSVYVHSMGLALMHCHGRDVDAHRQVHTSAVKTAGDNSTVVVTQSSWTLPPGLFAAARWATRALVWGCTLPAEVASPLMKPHLVLLVPAALHALHALYRGLSYFSLDMATDIAVPAVQDIIQHHPNILLHNKLGSSEVTHWLLSPAVSGSTT